MGYQNYGISKDFVERVKLKLKDPAIYERVKMILDNVTKSDLQDPSKVKRLLGLVSKAMSITISDQQSGQIIQFVVDQKIDPKNRFHLIKLWGMFR